MKHIFLFLLLSSLLILGDEGDIVETKTVNLISYSNDKSSYCKDRTPEEDLIWHEDFDEGFEDSGSGRLVLSCSTGF